MVLFAKILMYALNAYLDAQIAEEIIVYINSGGKTYATNNTIERQRAERFITAAKITSKELKKDPSYLIGIAYTQYYLNGLADILYANLFWHVLLSPKKSHMRTLYSESTNRFRATMTTTFQYEEIIHQPGISVWYWPFVVADPWRWADTFAKERCGFTGTLNKDSLRKASIEVQHQNIENNRQVAQAITKQTKSSDPKVIEINKVAKQVDNPAVFLREAAAIQLAAAKWDKLFIWLINR